MAAATSPLFDRVVYINLARRPDRLASIQAQLAKVGLAGERFEARPHRMGCYGASLSHLEVLRQARDRGDKGVLILEDDYEIPGTAEEFWDALNAVHKQLGTDFDVCMLYTAPDLVGDEVSGTIRRVQRCSGAVAYIVRHTMYDQLIAAWEAAAPALLATGTHWYYALDVAWWPLQSSSRWYGFSPSLCKTGNYTSDTGMHPELA